MIVRGSVIVVFLIFGFSFIDAQKTEHLNLPEPLPATNGPETTSTPTTTTTTTTSTTTSKPPPKSTTTTTTTTTKPPLTTTAAPVTTTTPAPAPPADPEIVTWNSSCIMVRMAAQLNFSYETKDNINTYGLYNIPKNSVVEDANCEHNTTQGLQINWGPKEAQHVMSLQFLKNNGTFNLTMIMFTIPLLNDTFSNAKENQTITLVHRGPLFAAPVQMSYHCTRPQIFNMTSTIMNDEVVGTLKVHDVQMEAFRTPNKTGFSTARDCDSTETSDVVPIAVGIALVALIMIVLVSYLCARRRSNSRGYMSF